MNFDHLPDEEPLLVKVGISPVDLEGAFHNLEQEAPHWDFKKIVQNAKKAWQKDLNRIQVYTDDITKKKIFYTAMYHSMIAPMVYQDVDGRYRGMDDQIHKAKEGQTYYTVYSLWDTFRALHPLMSIIDEKRTIDWVNDLLLKYQQGGILPKWALASNYTGTMIGYPAVANLADALTKGFKGIDKKLALQAALTSASYLPNLPQLKTHPKKDKIMTLHNKYINQGTFIPADKIVKSVSYGLENAYYDWCVMKIASIAGDEDTASRFKKRAKNYSLYFDKTTGFMRGKNHDGSWRSPFNPKYSSHEGSDYVEGNAWQWNWFVPHDVKGFVKHYGSKAIFEQKLDSLFTVSSTIEGENISGDITGLIGQYAHGNEPSHHTVYLYNYIGKYGKAQQKLDTILNHFYTDKPDGIIGNEDCGQMSAWYILSSIGFYQVAPGNPTYTIGRPLFEKVVIPLASGLKFIIKTHNNSPEHKYVKTVKLNGKVLKDWFFTHDDLKKGGLLEITMGNSPGL